MLLKKKRIMKQYKWCFERHRPTSTLAMGEFLHSVKNACFPPSSGAIWSSLYRFYWSTPLDPFLVTCETSSLVTCETSRSKAQLLSVTFTEGLERKQHMCTAIPPLLNIYVNLLWVSNKSNYVFLSTGKGKGHPATGRDGPRGSG